MAQGGGALIRARRSGAAIVAAAVVAVAGGCSKEEPAPKAVGGGASAAAFDWSAVRPDPDGAKRMEHLTVLTRLVDAWHGGRSPMVRLTFALPMSVRDAAGNKAVFSPQAWVSAKTLIASSPDNSAATRAMPTGAHRYGDGLGKVQRYSYTAIVDGDSIVFRLERPIAGESDD